MVALKVAWEAGFCFLIIATTTNGKDKLEVTSLNQPKGSVH